MLTLTPISGAVITHEQVLRDVGVHFVHLRDVMNEKSTMEELRTIKRCLQTDIVVSVRPDQYNEFACKPLIILFSYINENPCGCLGTGV